MDVAVIAYVALSREDEGTSLGSQLAGIEAACEREGQREIVETYRDEGSGYQSDREDGLRGPDAAAAREHAARLAKEGRPVELWVWRSDRLGRGDGLTAAHLTEHVLWGLKNGVDLRSATDDLVVKSMAFAGFVGDQNHGYSKAVSEHVTRGKQAQIEQGRRLGGPVPDGYKVVAETNQSGKVLSRRYLPDEGRAGIILEMFALSEAGHGDAVIAQQLNAAGHQTKNGKLWSRSRVQSTLRNGIYAGRHRRDVRGVDGRLDHCEWYPANDIPEPLISPERFDLLMAARELRDVSKAGREQGVLRDRRRGGSTTRYALHKLARCKRCGEFMYARTDGYRRRRDGGQQRYYACPHVLNGTGHCDAPFIDAALVDAALIPHLQEFFSDFAAWSKAMRDSNQTESRNVERQLEAAQQRLAISVKAEKAAKAKAKRCFQDGEDQKADAALEVMADEQVDRRALEGKVAALHDTLTELSSQSSPTDTMLDYWRDLSETIFGRLTSATSMGAVNKELRVALDHVILDTVGIDPDKVYARGGHDAKELGQEGCLVVDPDKLEDVKREAMENVHITIEPVQRVSRLPLAAIHANKFIPFQWHAYDSDGVWGPSGEPQLIPNRRVLKVGERGLEGTTLDVAAMPADVRAQFDAIPRSGGATPDQSASDQERAFYQEENDSWKPWHWGRLQGSGCPVE